MLGNIKRPLVQRLFVAGRVERNSAIIFDATFYRIDWNALQDHPTKVVHTHGG